jgi:hypothetical protein
VYKIKQYLINDVPFPWVFFSKTVIWGQFKIHYLPVSWLVFPSDSNNKNKGSNSSCEFFWGECCLFWWDWSLNSGFHACKAGILLLEPHH